MPEASCSNCFPCCCGSTEEKNILNPAATKGHKKEQIPPIPDFSGTWKLDTDKSETPEKVMEAQGLSYVARKTGCSVFGMSKVIHEIYHNVRNQRMIVEITTRLKAVPMELILDGTPHVIESEEAGMIRCTCLWNGRELELNGAGEQGKLKIVRSLENPEWMKVFTEFTSPKGVTGSMMRYFQKIEDNWSPTPRPTGSKLPPKTSAPPATAPVRPAAQRTAGEPVFVRSPQRVPDDVSEESDKELEIEAHTAPYYNNDNMYQGNYHPPPTHGGVQWIPPTVSRHSLSAPYYGNNPYAAPIHHDPYAPPMQFDPYAPQVQPPQPYPYYNTGQMWPMPANPTHPY